MTLVVGFAVLGVIGVLLDDPAGDTRRVPSASPAELDARVNFDGTQIKVVNRDDFAWTDCEISINSGVFGGGWTQEIPRIPAGDSAVGGIMAFTDSDAKRFNPSTHAVESVEVICRTPGGRSAVWSGEW